MAAWTSRSGLDCLDDGKEGLLLMQKRQSVCL